MTEVRIDQMHIRIHRLTPQEAREVGSEVAGQLSERVESLQAPLHLGALDLRLRPPADASQAEIVEIIVEAILERLRWIGVQHGQRI